MMLLPLDRQWRDGQSALKHNVFERLAPREAIEIGATTLQRRSAVASLELELCGVISTFGGSWNGRRDGRRSGSAAVGYCHHTFPVHIAPVLRRWSQLLDERATSVVGRDTHPAGLTRQS
jgi:hypothetical protein